MSEWTEKCVNEVIKTLDASGRSDLSEDLQRIIQKVNFDDLDVLCSPILDGLADEILEAETIERLGVLIQAVAKSMGLDHCTLHVITESSVTHFAPKVLTSYSDNWISLYVNRRYSYIDPVSVNCSIADRGFYWHNLEMESPVVKAFWREASEHGVGPSGYTIPLTTERGDKLAISVCSQMKVDDFVDKFDGFKDDLFTIGVFAVDAFIRLSSEDRPASLNPTDDQLTILRHVAMGATEAELRERAYLFGSYATLERSICSLFRTRTVAQAAVLAARIGILADAPLTKADIVRSAESDIPGRVNDVPLRRLVKLLSPA
jgi:hypothetical protein